MAAQERKRLFGPVPEPPEVQQLRRQAVEEAQQMAEESVREAQRLREEARQSGYQAGYAEGYAAGMAAAKEEADRMRAEFRADIEAIVERIEAERRRLWREAEPQILAFVLEIAQKVVKEEAAIHRDIAVSTVRNALRRIIDTARVRIRVNLADLQTVRSARDELRSLVDGVHSLEVIEDRRVSPGGCMVETDAGIIDERIESQFDEIRKALRDVLGEAA